MIDQPDLPSAGDAAQQLRSSVAIYPSGEGRPAPEQALQALIEEKRLLTAMVATLTQQLDEKGATPEPTPEY
jgi:hypothetical protein